MVKKLHPSDALCLHYGAKVLESIGRRNLQVFDVGANEGLFARQIHATWSDLIADIRCFEPNQAAYRELLARTADIEAVTTVQCGLGEARGTAKLYHPEKKTVLGSLINRPIFSGEQQKWGKVTEQIIDVTTVDYYMTEHSIGFVDYLKIDTEGTELSVLKGAESALREHRVACGQFEYGGTFADAGLSIRDVVAYLENFDYVVLDVLKDGRVDRSAQDDFLLNNYFFCERNRMPASIENG